MVSMDCWNRGHSAVMTLMRPAVIPAGAPQSNNDATRAAAEEITYLVDRRPDRCRDGTAKLTDHRQNADLHGAISKAERQHV